MKTVFDASYYAQKAIIEMFKSNKDFPKSGYILVNSECSDALFGEGYKYPDSGFVFSYIVGDKFVTLLIV